MSKSVLRTRRAVDLLICILGITGALIFSHFFDFKDWLLRPAHDHDKFGWDEMMVAVGTASVMFFWYGLRRRKDYLTEYEWRLAGELKLQEEIQTHKRMEDLSHLTAGIAQEYNNKLAVISGNVELLAERVGPDTPHIQNILSAVEYCANLTHHLLAFTRQQNMIPRPLNLTTELPRLLEMAAGTYHTCLQVSCRTPEGPAIAMVDEQCLVQALRALLLNAWEAKLADNRVEVSCELVKRICPKEQNQVAAVPRDFVQIDIKDYGKGMHQLTREQAIEPFFTTKEVGQGLGLGLSMVHGFAGQSGGFLEVQSTLQKGSTVSLFLPAAV